MMLDEAQAERESKGIPELSPEQEKQISEEVAPLFQASYKILYEDGLIEVLIKELEDGQPIEDALSRILTGLLSAVIKDKGVDSMDVLFNLGILLMSDILNSLQELGLAEMEEANAQKVIAKTVEAVMKGNPEFAQKVMQDPRTAEMMKGAGDQLGTPQQPQPPMEAEQEGVMPPPQMGGM